MSLGAAVLPRIMNRALLNTNEMVLIEERPAFLSVVGMGAIVWGIIGSLIFFSLATVRYLADFAIFLWFLAVVLPIAIRVLRWRHMFFALSDQRLMQGSGIIGSRFAAFDLTRTSGMIDVSTYRITGVAFDQSAFGRMAGFGNIIFNTNRGNIHWKGIKDPLNVRRNVEEKVSGMQTGQFQDLTYNDEMIRRTAQIRTDQAFGYLPHQEAKTNIPNQNSPAPLQHSIFCSSCGARNSIEGTFCSKCGSRLAKEN